MRDDEDAARGATVEKEELTDGSQRRYTYLMHGTTHHGLNYQPGVLVPVFTAAVAFLIGGAVAIGAGSTLAAEGYARADGLWPSGVSWAK